MALTRRRTILHSSLRVSSRRRSSWSAACALLLTGLAFGGCSGNSEVNFSPSAGAGNASDAGLDADANADADAEADATADANADAGDSGGAAGQSGVAGAGGEAGGGLDCAPGTADCDRNRSNGCEADLTSVDHCGSCAQACALDHASVKCQKGACVVDKCDAGFADCDGEAKNGCETPLNTLTDCGSCGQGCALASGTATCETGTCTVATCETGAADCDKNPANGCETPLNTLTNCGVCGTACTLANATATCGDRTCKVQKCAAGFDNCDKLQPNGCETSLKQITNCGACGKACAVANGKPTCSTGTCAIASCSAGFGNCNSVASDGCETALTSLSNCGSCGQGCSLANASASCSTGTCAVAGCASGYGNCDGQNANGCEAPLNTSNNCGACGQGCSLDHASASCGSGSCQITACDSGWGDCDGQAYNGCEQALGAYYYDNDLDGYGGGYAPVYACSQPDHYSSNNYDCYDANASAYPGQSAFFTTDRGDGSFDYNCDGGWGQQFTSIGGCSSDCTSGVVGWCEDPTGILGCNFDGNAVPGCGATGLWTGLAGVGALCINFFGCTAFVTPQTQACQ